LDSGKEEIPTTRIWAGGGGARVPKRGKPFDRKKTTAGKEVEKDRGQKPTGEATNTTKTGLTSGKTTQKRAGVEMAAGREQKRGRRVREDRATAKV